VQVGDLVRRGESLAITTSTAAVFRLSPTEPESSLCEARGWRVRTDIGSDAQANSCARAVCELLQADASLSERLSTVWQRSAQETGEAPPPREWRPASPSPAEITWFVECTVTCVLLVALALLRWRSRTDAAPATDWRAIAVIALGSLALHIVLALRRPILIDEMFFFGRDSFWREFGEYETVMNPPFYRLLSLPISIWTHGAPGAGRVVPIVLGVSLIAVLGHLGTILGGRSTGIAAAILSGFHPGLVMATVYHRSYAALVFTTALSLLLVAQALRSRRFLDRSLAAVALAATFESHYFGAAVIAGAVLWILLEERGRVLAWLGPLSLTVLLCAPLAAAALVGAHQKERLGVDSTAVLHGWGLAESVPAVLAGLLRPELQDVLYNRHTTIELGVAGAVLLLVLGLGTRTLGRRTAAGLMAVAGCAALIPVVLAFRIVTVREFQVIAAAVPVVTIAAASFARIPWRITLPLYGAVAVLFLTRLPLDPAPPDHAAVAAQAILADPSHWPVFVWGPGERSYLEIALNAGLSRPVADASVAGSDDRVRALRSCSTAATREAAQSLHRSSIRILTDASNCTSADLSGRGVRCVSASTPGEMDCDIDLQQPWAPVEEWNESLDRVIPPGNESVFVAAAAPMRLSKPSADGTRLTHISIDSNSVSYELHSAGARTTTLVVSPAFATGKIMGTKVVVDPAPPPAELQVAVNMLSARLQVALTPETWKEVYVPGVRGRNGKTPLHLAESLGISLLAGLIFLTSLWRWTRRT
jgi:antitoxin (DNA-binding transcriptional repressor) of toxin-antitoxin stability system